MAGRIQHAATERPVLVLAVADIDVPEDRLRTLKPDEAAAIGASIKADRQYDPISVSRLPGSSRYLLVDGLHRLEGCRRAAIETIDALLVPNDRVSRRRQEVVSAWARATHDAFDKAAQVAAMVAIAQGHNVDVADADEASATVALAAGWDVSACETLDMSRRNLFNYLKLHRFYDDGQKRILRERALAAELVPLVRLAALPPEDFTVAFAAIAEGRVSSIAEALAIAAPGEVAVFDKQVRSIVKKIDGWDQVDRARFIQDLLSRYDRNGAPRRAIADGKTC